MKKINDLKDGDVLWFRLTHKHSGETKEVRSITSSMQSPTAEAKDLAA